MMRQKRGQAAMEFLMTYGWAILVVLIAIGALAYFGVLNPSRFLPASCTLTPGLSCEEFKVNTTTVVIRIQNGLGKDLRMLNVSTALDATNCKSASQNQSLNDGVVSTFLMRCTSALTSGTRFKEDLLITWQESGSTLEQSRTGQIISEVQTT